MKDIDFFDLEAGLDFYRKCDVFEGSFYGSYFKVKISVSSDAVILVDKYILFIKGALDASDVLVEEMKTAMSGAKNVTYTRIFVLTALLENQSDAQFLLRNGMLLNSYSAYFMKNMRYKDIRIAVGALRYATETELKSSFRDDAFSVKPPFHDFLQIDEYVKNRSDAQNELKNTFTDTGFYPYDYTMSSVDEQFETCRIK